MLDKELTSQIFILGEQYSAADIALYAYTHCAGSGGFDMNRYTAINNWFERVAAQDNYLAIDEQP